MSYNDRFTDHFDNPRNIGTLDTDSDDVGTGVIGSPKCGDIMRFQLRIVDGRIVEARFKTFGCGAAIASSSLATEKLIGMTIEQAEALTNDAIANELDLPPVKIHCSVLAEDAIKSALNDWRKKNGLPVPDECNAPCQQCQQDPWKDE